MINKVFRLLSRHNIFKFMLLPTNSHWPRVVGYGPFSLCVIHKQGLCPSNGGINTTADLA
jgi:hypothetical protein